MVEKFFLLFLPSQNSILSLRCGLYSFSKDGLIRCNKTVWRRDIACFYETEHQVCRSSCLILTINRVSTTEENFNNQGDRELLRIQASVSSQTPQCSCSDPISRVTEVARKEPMHGPQSMGSLTKVAWTTGTARSRDWCWFLDMTALFNETSQPLRGRAVTVVPSAQWASLLDLIPTLHVGLFFLPKVPPQAWLPEAFQNTWYIDVVALTTFHKTERPILHQQWKRCVNRFYCVPCHQEAASLIEWWNGLLKSQLSHHLRKSNLQGWSTVLWHAIYVLNYQPVHGVLSP